MIYLISGSGEPNYGDDLIVSLWVKYYRERGYTGRILIDCKSVQGSLSLHSELDDLVYFVSHIKSLTRGRKGDVHYYIELGKQFVQKYFTSVVGINPKGQECELDINYNEIQVVHLVGGGYINGSWPNSFAIFGAVEALKETYNIPCYATGLGLAPLSKYDEKEKNKIAEIAHNCFDLLEVRDFESYVSLIKDNKFNPKIINGIDDTFLYSIDNLTVKDTIKKLHVSGFKGAFNKVDLLSIIENILSVEGVSKIIFWACNKNDMELFEYLKKYYPNIDVIDNNELIYKKISINSGDVMLTARFHPHFIGLRKSLKGYYIAHSGFYKNKHKSLVNMGSNFNDIQQENELEKNIQQFEDGPYVLTKRVIADYIYQNIK